MNNLTDRDRKVVVPALEKMDTSDREARFDQALKMEASLELLKDLALTYLTYRNDGYEVIGLPYVKKLVDAKYQLSEVAAIVSHLCLVYTRAENRSQHVDGFWADYRAEKVFEDADSLSRFLMALADQDPNGILKHHAKIQRMFAARREPLESQLARDDTTQVLSRAAAHLECVTTDDMLNLLLKQVTASSRIKAALQVAPTRHGLMLMGAVMTGFSLSPTEASDLVYKANAAISDLMAQTGPDEAIMAYRWMLEGAKMQTGLERFEFHEGFKRVQSALVDNGFQILRVTNRGNEGHVSHELQVRLELRGKRTIIKPCRLAEHRADSNRHEHIEAGDEVIFHPYLLNPHRPKISRDNLLIYVDVELHPLQPPTATHQDAIRRDPSRHLI